MKTFALFAAAVGALAYVVAAASKCTADAPCFREGWCDSGPMFCMFSLCNVEASFNSTSCWKPEGCSNQNVGFDSSSDVVAIRGYSGNPIANPFVSIFEPNNAAVSDGNLVLQMNYDAANKRGFGATTSASHTFQYGRVTARIKTAAIAKGTVSAFIIRNDQVGDEIDFEWVGKSPNQVQTNFFYHDILDYSNSEYFDVGSNTATTYHDYTIDWTPEAITWIVDGKTLRKLNRKDTYDSKTKVYKFPSAEGRIGFSIWDGGNSGSDGTEKWAGTPTPWTPSTVYKMFVDSVKITCAKENPKPPVSSTTSTTSTTAATTTTVASSTSTTTTAEVESTTAATTTAAEVTPTTTTTSESSVAPPSPTTLVDTNVPTDTASVPDSSPFIPPIPTDTTSGNPPVVPPIPTITDPKNPSVQPPTPTDSDPKNPPVQSPTPTDSDPKNPSVEPPKPTESGRPPVQPPTDPTSSDSNRKCFVVYRTVTV
ncbi:putative glycosidase CRH2 [Coemansia sp. RSA 2050]|nr:putative glycosidase CRH2 [Coemansia sp. RSA 2050]KAJ2733195.1 putative glycosidase CRH2 [Coemansia sp. BCRC 34962]